MSFHIMVGYIDGTALNFNYEDSLPSDQLRSITDDLAKDLNVSSYYFYTIDSDTTTVSPVTYIAENIYTIGQIDSIPKDKLPDNIRSEINQMPEGNADYLFQDRKKCWHLIKYGSEEFTNNTTVVNSKNNQLYPHIDCSR